jgi:hypothetical protein
MEPGVGEADGVFFGAQFDAGRIGLLGGIGHFSIAPKS